MARRKVSDASSVDTLRQNSEGVTLDHSEARVLEVVAEDYAHATIQLCIDKGVKLEDLADDFALLIAMLEKAAIDAARVGNTHVTTIAKESYTLLRLAAVHFPEQTPRLIKVLSHAPEPQTVSDTLRLAMAT
jgi:Zn-dependent oligopeptidase